MVGVGQLATGYRQFAVCYGQLHVAWRDNDIEQQTYSCCNKRGEQCIADGVAEDASGIRSASQCCQSCSDSQYNGWYRQQLEQPDIDGGYKVCSLVNDTYL